ncbi:MAG: winged helix-turn-helix domain-containing protein [Halobacteriales archaeon]|nr:winged helix-turn-helix domain-containing protein [Halobacteriales archaeon]
MARDRVQIYADLLRAVKARGTADGARITPVQSDANLPSDRARQYIGELVQLGLLTGPPYLVTPKGEAFLREYNRYRHFLRDFGLVRDDGEPGPPPF